MSNSSEDQRNWENLQRFENIPNDGPFESPPPQPDVYVYGNNIPSSTATTTSSGCYHQPMSESYSVLPVGRGNFLKVYHSNENEPPAFNSYELFSSNSLIPPHNARIENSENNQNFSNNENTTNMLINQLVTNWTPNLSGNYSPFGEQNQQQHQHMQQQYQHQQQQQQHQPNPQQTPNHSPSKPFTKTTSSEIIIDAPSTATFVPTQTKIINNIKPTSTPKTNGSFENHQINTPEIKKRIVAEVKPMRMSYSDVLSKNVDANNIVNIGTKNGINNSSIESANQIKVSKFSSLDKNKIANERKNHYDDKDKNDFLKMKKNDNLSNNKSDDLSHNLNGINQPKDKKKMNYDDNKDSNTINNLNKKMNNKKPIITEKNKLKNGQQNSSDNMKKRSSNRRDFDDDNNKTKYGFSNDKECFYNIAKTEINYEKPHKNLQIFGTKKSRHNPKNNSNNNGLNNNSNNVSNSQRSDRHNYLKRGQKPRKDIKYELISKFIEKWLEYTIKILTWLFYLIYDIIVLSFGIAYDRFKIFYINSYAFLINLHHDFKQNSGKPNAWLKNLFKKFDNKFKKNSKLAFWRKFNKKKRIEEQYTEFYKNGRLPQTGDEAMYSLLNCKGKDAYSILGVLPDSSQEQIRKHYKKIAVLVHPDKNKQPGAEEAFKVLQRAFELIGEPENRKSYDQSLAEALNAEKAWSELHDLLSQLQSKIAEAANTIRCSSCGLRHPRKLTDRHHYAARECSSCKIRHSAREGDIWAETSIFGLRWKYLALMEGKCYDITEWANCQKGALSHLQPNSHIVQYRIVRGGQQQQQQQQNVNLEKEKHKRDIPNEPTLDEFLDNLYSGQNPQQNSSRRRTRRN